MKEKIFNPRSPSLPIDQVVNSQRMLQTGQYQYSKSKISEDIWLMAYLIRKGEPKQKIKDFWWSIFLTRHPWGGDDFYKETEFENRFAIASNWKLTERNRIVIYQKEIEAILSIDTQISWIREYALMVLAYFKAIGNKTKEAVEAFPKEALRGLTSFKRVQDGINESYICAQAGLFEAVSSEYLQKSTGLRKGSTYIKIYFLQTEGKEVFSADSILDIPKCFSFVHKKYKCPICGKEFEKNSKTKRNICFSCWESKREERAKKFFDTTKKHNRLCE